ncbi:putative signal transducing protein [Stratiformator vulcanicus]|uniref:Uncharacterized protein n=1 Tax=Stratiformator vulcanicus TaxID=2527980 RepID=A0A517R7J3_9PLAN|nr:DUF2007 domain-containing protein [Stratiformator vulcanicus]QDT39856.1 hypothetical protein Pan189_42680 [Stratiformator vulcanicus]
MNSGLTEITTCASEVNANHLKAVLAAEGIEAFVAGGRAETMMSYVGVALGGVNLLTRPAQAEAAREIISGRQHSNDATQPDWYCRDCKVAVDCGFECCWSCEQSRGLVGGEIPPGEIDSDEEALGEIAEVDAADIEARVTRAYRAALFGIGLFPGFLHLYSSYLLNSVIGHFHAMSLPTVRRWYAAMIVNIAMIFVIHYVLLYYGLPAFTD